jgi:Caspase domain
LDIAQQEAAMFKKCKSLACRVFLGVALAAVVSVTVGFGARAAVRHRAHRPTAVHSIEKSRPSEKFSRVALIVGNGSYPDADTPFKQPSDDVHALTPVLEKAGFSVVALEDARERDLHAAIAFLKERMQRDATVVVFYSGYAIQVDREDFIVPVDARIWNEDDVLRQGISIDRVLAELREAGAGAELVAVDASWRNPFERRFRAYSHGLAPIVAPVNSLVLVSDPFNLTTDDKDALRGLGRQMVTSLGAAGPGSAFEVFQKIRSDLVRLSSGSRMPTVTSSLTEDVIFALVPHGELLAQSEK